MIENVYLNKIAILVVYFGKFPNSVTIWADSAKRQKNIDFIFITDQNQESYLESFTFIKYEFHELINHINFILNFDSNIKFPYKLVDFKPAYGIIFKNILSNYNYWGYCDLDLIFGDLNSFILKCVDEQTDMFYSRGHFSFFRNNENFNNLFKTNLLIDNKIINYKQIYCTEKVFIFDETYGIFKIFRSLKKNIFHNSNFIDINCNSIRFTSTNTKNYLKQFFVYDNGKIYHYYKTNIFDFSNSYLKSEYSYIHFQKRKILFNTFDNPNKIYLIRGNSLLKFNTIEEIIRYNYLFSDFFIIHFFNRFFERIFSKYFIFNNSLNTGTNY
jgi:hypothetical protein